MQYLETWYPYGLTDSSMVREFVLWGTAVTFGRCGAEWSEEKHTKYMAAIEREMGYIQEGLYMYYERSTADNIHSLMKKKELQQDPYSEKKLKRKVFAHPVLSTTG